MLGLRWATIALLDDFFSANSTLQLSWVITFPNILDHLNGLEQSVSSENFSSWKTKFPTRLI